LTIDVSIKIACIVDDAEYISVLCNDVGIVWLEREWMFERLFCNPLNLDDAIAGCRMQDRFL